VVDQNYISFREAARVDASSLAGSTRHVALSYRLTP
jgi:hypothetical protein